MDLLLSLFTLLGVLVLGTISPGPSFVMVARTSVSYSRKHGLAASFGMGVGGTIFALAALFGLKALLLAVPSLHILLKVLGGIYLIYIGIRIWKSAKEKLEDKNHATGETKKTPFRSFLIALATQISNPKTAVVYASVFAALLPPNMPIYFFALIPCIVFFIEFTWYALVAFCLSSPAPRSIYLKFKTTIDRIAGCAMIVLGLKLIASGTDDF